MTTVVDRQPATPDLLTRVRERAERAFLYVGGLTDLAGQTVQQLRRGPLERPLVAAQFDQIGFRSLSIVIITSAFIGMVLMSLMVGGRVGAGMAAELGTMKVTEQIDALRALATNPVRKLVVPRVVACTLMFPLLTIVAIALGILGGLLIAVTNLHLSANYYLRSVVEAVKYNDLASGIGKTFFFGAVVSLIACYNGLATSGGADGVGRSTTQTVVTGAITVLIMDFFLTKLFLFLF
jgi:phospholipid/cholesterol/gamma-HCH transport system permease protein